MKEEIKYGFGLCKERCFADTFDTIDDLLYFAKRQWDNLDNEYFQEDNQNIIYIGVARSYEPFDFAPSLDEIAYSMDDSFYGECNIDDDEIVRVHDKEKAKEEYKAFINKYFELPCTIVCHWIGTYDLKGNDWVERFDK